MMFGPHYSPPTPKQPEYPSRRLPRVKPYALYEILAYVTSGISTIGFWPAVAAGAIMAGPVGAGVTAATALGTVILSGSAIAIGQMNAENRPPSHSPLGHELAIYPRPSFLSNSGLNFGIIGTVSSGKSSVFNHLTTERANTTFHESTGTPNAGMIRSAHGDIPFFDLPGYGTVTHRSATYIKDMGLRHFSALLLCIGDAVREEDVLIVEYLGKVNIPFVVVRTKIDTILQNAEYDSPELFKEEVLERVIDDTHRKLNCPTTDIYLVTVRSNTNTISGWSALIHRIATISNSYMK